MTWMIRMNKTKWLLHSGAKIGQLQERTSDKRGE